MPQARTVPEHRENDVVTQWTAMDYDPYTAVIEHLVGQEFPQLSSGRVEDVMASVVTEFIATKQYRIGPRPNPESEVKIRDVVRRAVSDGRPIPVLVPAASVKLPIGESMDVAELSALRMLACLHRRVQRHYEPGMAFRMRLEDLTEYVLSPDVPHVEHHVRTYQQGLHTLLQVLGYDDFITLVPESGITDAAAFMQNAAAMIPEIEAYLDATDGLADDAQLRHPLFQRIQTRYALLWPITALMRQYFRARYVKLYPSTPATGQNHVMAQYYAAVLTRRIVGAVGNDPTFDGRLEVYFGIALPDAPVVSTRVLYRTVPLAQSTLHLPYWNAKGHVKINNDGGARIALGRWDEPAGTYVPGQLTVSRGASKTSVRADYRVVEG